MALSCSTNPSPLGGTEDLGAGTPFTLRGHSTALTCRATQMCFMRLSSGSYGIFFFFQKEVESGTGGGVDALSDGWRKRALGKGEL